MNRRGKWIIATAGLAALGLTLAFTWESCLRALVYNRPLAYDHPFAPVIEQADKVIVRADGFDCCGPVNETNVLFQVTDPEEVNNLRKHLVFISRTTTNAFMETCMCCGGPGIDWYKGNKRVALTAMQHGYSIRWRGFSTVRILGFRFGYGDGPLTEESQQWLDSWFASHGVKSKKMETANHALEGTGEPPTARQYPQR